MSREQNESWLAISAQAIGIAFLVGLCAVAACTPFFVAFYFIRSLP